MAPRFAEAVDLLDEAAAHSLGGGELVGLARNATRAVKTRAITAWQLARAGPAAWRATVESLATQQCGEDENSTATCSSATVASALAYAAPPAHVVLVFATSLALLVSHEVAVRILARRYLEKFQKQ